MDDVDLIKYPELYRKTGHEKGSNKSTNPPFDIAIIMSIRSRKVDKSNVRLTVRNLYRPQQTKLDMDKASRKDLNMVYWTDVEVKVNVDLVEGKCFVKSEQSLDKPVDQWTKEGEHRFYFNSFYDRFDNQFDKIPDIGKIILKVI
jgi:hypothetical protein